MIPKKEFSRMYIQKVANGYTVHVTRMAPQLTNQINLDLETTYVFCLFKDMMTFLETFKE